MIVAYKNYKRTERALLSIASVKHFMPHADIHCLFLFDESPEEMAPEVELVKDAGASVHFAKNKHRLGPAAFSKNNGFYFSEYLNYFSAIFKGESKVLAMDEDNYFTTGETLRWIDQSNFDLAWAKWDCPDGLGVNASIVGLNFQTLSSLFPLSERLEYIEMLLKRELYDRALLMGATIKEIPTRNCKNYFGDGSWTNNISVMKKNLLDAKIIGG